MLGTKNMEAIMKTIDVTFLKRKHACKEQIALFRRTFGESVKITRANCLKAAEVELDFDWAAIKLLSSKALKTYSKEKISAWRDYEVTKVQAQNTYEKTEISIWRAYHTAKADAWNALERNEISEQDLFKREDEAGYDYDKSEAEALMIRRQTISLAWKVYKKEQAIVFYEAWKEDK